MKITTGLIPFGKYQTFYRVVGDLNKDQIPLILLHGGPGSTHNYFEAFDVFAKQGFPIVMYDQFGCGKSSTAEDLTEYTPKNWLDELENLISYLDISDYHLLGQSFGGMLAIMFAIDRKPKGLKTLVLSSTLSSAKLWAKEQHRLIKFLPQKEQKAIKRAERENNFLDLAYQEANAHFMEQHATGPYNEKTPLYLTRPKNIGTQSYNYAWGPNEYVPTGVLGNYNYTDRLNEIKIPTLITSGTNDLCTPLVAKTMFDQIENATWELFAESRHMPFIDEHELYMEKLSTWLREVNN